MPIIYHEGYSLGDGAGNNQLLKDTVGWTGKNRAYSQTNNAVVAHIENGITYDVSWTGSATVTLKKNSASGATIMSGSTSPLSFTADADYELYFGSSATVTNIMVKDSRITDPTYEPYHESVEEEIEQVYADNGVLGAKNLCSYPYNRATGATLSGVTITVNSDYSVTLNGTANNDNGFDIHRRTPNNNETDLYLPEGDYIFSSPTTQARNAILTIGTTKNGKYNLIARGYVGEEVHFSISSQDSDYVKDGRILIAVYIDFKNGNVFSNCIIYPLIRLASDPDDTYVPYAMTNRELTEKVNDRASKSIITSNDVFDPTKTYAVGDWLIHQGVLYEVITACTGVTPPNATYYKVKTLHDLKSEIDAICNWSSEEISATVDGQINLYVNKSLKLAIVFYNSKTAASEGTFTMPNWVIPTVIAYGALRNNGYLNVYAGSTQGTIVNSTPYSVGQLAFPIR